MPRIEAYGLPPFEEIEAALASDAPRRWGLSTSKGFSLVVDPGEGALWLLCPAEGETIALPAQTTVINIASRKIGNGLFYQVGSKFKPLLREFFYFLEGIVHRAEEKGGEFSVVVATELAAWEALLRMPNRLTLGEEVGLLGELWVLWRTLNNHGPAAIDAWTGPSSEQHDFRLNDCDLEVKTTLSHSRDHTINGADQLQTSAKRVLYLVSIQIKPAGDGPGSSLCDAISRISDYLSNTPVASNTFNKKIASFGYRHSDALYSERYCLRSDPVAIQIDETFPRLTNEALSKVLSDSTLRRLRRVTYMVNLDGMGLTLDSVAAPDSLCPCDSGDLYA